MIERFCRWYVRDEILYLYENWVWWRSRCHSLEQQLKEVKQSDAEEKCSIREGDQ